MVCQVYNCSIKLAELALKGAFAEHVLDESTVHEVGDEAETFHILLSGGTGVTLDLVYTYTKPSGKLIAMGIVQLPSNWTVMISRLNPKVITILTPGPGANFEFDMNDPFSARVVE